MELIDRLLSFPLVLTAAPFALLLVLMIISLVTGAFDQFGASAEVGADAGADLDAELGADSGADVGEAGDLDADADSHALRLLVPAGFAQYPLVVSLTVAFFFATLILFYADMLLAMVLGGWLLVLVEIVLILAALFAGLHLSMLALRPLAPLFDRERTFARIDYVGMRATVRSNRVSPRFGEVVVTKGGIENQLDVYCDEGIEIAYGESVIVVSYDADTSRYRVIRDK